MAARVRIIGIGSPFGDDRLGWVAAERLRDSPAVQAAAERIDISVLDGPGNELIAQWKGADTVVVIDAVRSGAMPGTVHCLDAAEIGDDVRLISSHGFGLASALALGRALGELPNRTYVCGIELDPAHSAENLSPAIRAALPQLLHQVEGLAVTEFVSSSPAGNSD
jgi:hydrogenase maturation protease